MRRSIWLIGLLLVARISVPLSSSCPGEYAAGLVLVRFRPGLSQAARQAGLDVAAAIPPLDVVALRVPEGQECAALRTLRRDPRVAYAELDYAARAAGEFIPNDPAWSQQWGPARISAPAAWSLITGTPDVLIAVVDSGITLDHPDLSDRLWVNAGEIPANRVDDDGNGKMDDVYGWRFYHYWNGSTYVPREDSRVHDDFGHGTHVSGIAAATIDNGVGVAGMAGGSRLMTVRVLDQYGNGWYSDIASGIVYAVDNGADVINLSLGGAAPSQLLQDAVDYARARDVLVIASAGNDGGPVLYPGACEGVLAVAATDPADLWASFSNHGPQVAVGAPGVDIYSTWPWVGGYVTRSGTSMAAPHVSGLAGLLRSVRPDMPAVQVAGVITATALDVNSATQPGWDEYLGWGRIEAAQAVSTALHSGNLFLTAQRVVLPVGETTTITAVLPLTVTSVVTFHASGGTVHPTAVPVATGLATTTLTGGPLAGPVVVTAFSEGMSGTLHLRLMPGSPVSAALHLSATPFWPGWPVTVTLEVTDSMGNPPLTALPVYWSANGGTVTPSQSALVGGIACTSFSVATTCQPATITATLAGGLSAVSSVEGICWRYYLPVVMAFPYPAFGLAARNDPHSNSKGASS